MIECNVSAVTWSNLLGRSSKEKFYLCLSAKLFDPSISAKTYWSILKTFVNGKQVPLISSLLVNGKFVTNFLEKANIFNDFFSQKCQSIPNDSILPLIPTYYKDNRLNEIKDKVIQSFDPNKAHGHDGVSVRMLKPSRPSIIKPLLIIFRRGLKFGSFPYDWKKDNFVPVHKKDNKQSVTYMLQSF